jgi:intracellular multiplication protein IcmS
MSLEVTRKMCLIAQAIGVKYSLNDRVLSYQEVFAESGLLPAIARRADQLSSLCLGYGIGVSFDEADKSLVGVKVVFDEVTPSVLRYMCMTDVLHELIFASSNKEVVALDELMYD